jgi:hypothetical protein
VSRARVLIIVALVVLFVIAGGVLIYANQHGGGQSRTFNLTVTKGASMTPDTLQAYQGDHITINITSDEDGEVHLHEYDIAFETKTGETVSHSFIALKTCACEIEWEETSAHLGTLTVSP